MFRAFYFINNCTASLVFTDYELSNCVAFLKSKKYDLCSCTIISPNNRRITFNKDNELVFGNFISA